MTLLVPMSEPGILEPYLFNTGGPRSRTRTERIESSLLGQDEAAIRMPRVLRVGLDYGDEDPLEAVHRLLGEAGINEPEMLKARCVTPTEPCLCRSNPDQSPVARVDGDLDRVLQQILILGLSTAFLYDPGRPLILTRASLTRCFDLYRGEGFYA
jgi:hypothetical protein